MHEQIERVHEHYQAGIADQDALLAKLTTAIDSMKHPITAEQLASFDQFHVGGLGATVELARRTGVSSNLRVLDAGSGLGGPSRYLAETFGCHVVGVDLAPAYVRVAKLLATAPACPTRSITASAVLPNFRSRMEVSILSGRSMSS